MKQIQLNENQYRRYSKRILFKRSSIRFFIPVLIEYIVILCCFFVFSVGETKQ